MQKRILLLSIAVLLPVLVAYGFARYAIVTSDMKNTTAIVEPPRQLPETQEEAIQMTQARLDHLKTLNQQQWDEERAKIPSRRPPPLIEDAVARAQLRLDELNAMEEEDWREEYQRMKRRAELSGH